MTQIIQITTNFKNEKDGEFRKVFINIEQIAAVEDVLDHNCTNIIMSSGKSIIAMSESADSIIKKIKKGRK